ncbi:hypothetical protein B484DRAFT_425470 [Ochromonadaceae sp. CCMP2298]|nr:hypothetical protein B484DRAFT_425470 [Ochromonadaceae sp. CCMP2298]
MQDYSLFRLPEALLREILGFLTLTEIARLDTASCVHVDRERLLNAVRGCVLDGDALPIRSSCLSWLFSRCVGLRNMDMTLSTSARMVCNAYAVRTAEARYVFDHTVSMIVSGFLPPLPQSHRPLFPSLQSLKLTEGMSTAISDRPIAELFSSCPHLQSLELDFCGGKDVFLVAVAAASCPKLHTLKIAGAYTTNDSLAAMVKCFPLLRSLEISSCVSESFVNGGGAAIAVAIAKHSPLLQSLKLCSDVENAHIFALAENCPRLQLLHLSGCFDVSDSSVVALARTCTGLESLMLEDCFQLTDVSVIALAKACPQLQFLYLPFCALLTNWLNSN